MEMPAASRSAEEMSDVHLLGALANYTSPLCPYASELEQPIQYQAPRKNGEVLMYRVMLSLKTFSLAGVVISLLSLTLKYSFVFYPIHYFFTIMYTQHTSSPKP